MSLSEELAAGERTGASDAERVLAVDNLQVAFPSDAGPVQAVQEVSFELRRGESVAIVGESGSGKSVTSMAIMGLLPKTATVSGTAHYRGQELFGATEKELTKIRGSKIAMIFQDPMTSLNPVYSIGYQIAEALRTHQDMTRAAARQRSIELLDTVGIPKPQERVDSYPHEMSGGMRQRVVIAIAMANDPDVIIADEPTTALDVTVQAQVLETLHTARRETGAALILITHDLGVVAGQAERVLVMYAGRLVEKGTADELYYTPRMPYTLGLLGSVPRMDRPRGERLTPIVGSPPSLVNQPPGCPFSARCPLAQEICDREEPALEATTSGGHLAACHFSERLQGAAPSDFFRPTAAGEDGEITDVGLAEADSADDVDALSVRHLVKHFPIKSKGVIRRVAAQVHAVCDVSFDLPPHQTLGLVGESGCGKTTTARTLLGLDVATSGEVIYKGRDLAGLSQRQMRSLRGNLQIVFQDPYASLDPRMPVNEIIAEPLRIHGRFADGGENRVRDLLQLVGLKPEHGNRYPHEFSGGQRQRVGVARALALQPQVLVLDEPVSALDVSIQAGVLNLLQELQEKLGLSYLFVSHDLSVVRHIADRIAVMYLGHIVETGSAEQIFSAPAHPYTQALISAIPLPDPHKERSRERIVIQGDVPSPVSPPSGCRFRTRCQTFANLLTDEQRKKCVEEDPELVEREQDWPVACHYAESASVL